MNIPRSPFYEKELDVRLARSYGPGRYDTEYEEKGHDYPIAYVRWTEGRNIAAFLDLMAQRKVDVNALTSHRFSLAAAEQAYALIEGKTGEPYLGVLLEYALPANDNQRLLNGVQPEILRLNKQTPAQRNAQTPVTVGLIGAGNFAQSMLLPHLRQDPRVHLHTVVTPGGLTARTVGDRASFAHCASDPELIFSDPAVQLVMIASRHNSHAELTTRALQVGKSVFVEKPLALSIDELQTVLDAYYTAQQTGNPPPVLMVGFNRRFAPLIAPLRDCIKQTGEPLLLQYRVNAGYIARDHWTQDPEEGGGRILGELCHFVDLLIYLVGQPPLEVQTYALPDLGRYSRDNLVTTLCFRDGSVGTITYAANGDKSLEKERLEVFSGGRVAVLDDFRQLTLHVNDSRKTQKTSPDKGHKTEMQALVASVYQNLPSPIPIEQIIWTMQTTFAVQESLLLGQTIKIQA